VAVIRRCGNDKRGVSLAIVNTAAEAYRGVIPADRWREPYMPREELDSEIAAGVDFWGYEDRRRLVGVMGIQPPRDVTSSGTPTWCREASAAASAGRCSST
jgi:hypothetical protein